jgi:hypothetical protein
VVHVLNEVEKREQLADLPVLLLDDLRKLVQEEPRATGYPIVRDTEIPQPWRERFQRASIGSTRAPEGAYAHDWQKFLSEWEAEMLHLANHREAMAQVHQRPGKP